MKKQTHTWTNYMPLLVAVITVIGMITVGAFNIYQNQKAIEVDLEWIKDNAKETKSEIEKLRHSVNISDDSINDIFMELLDRLEEYKKDRKGG